MGATHHLAVVAVDESGAALKLSSAKLTSGAAVNRSLAFGGATRNALSGLSADYMYVNASTYRREYDFLKKALGLAPDDTGYLLF